MSPSATQRLLVWAEPADEALVRDVAAQGLFELVAIGTPERGRAAGMGAALGVRGEDDLRRLVGETEADVLWLATTVGVGAARIDQLRGAPLRICAAEPIGAGIGDPASGAESVELAPRMVCSPAIRAARDVLEEFGHVEAVSVAIRCARGQSRLLSRLCDAVDTVLHFCGDPDSVDAALATSGSRDSLESLRALHGHLTANLRFPDDRCASLAVSDAAGAWFRGCTILGGSGCLRIGDDGFEWIGHDGRIHDRHRIEPAPTPARIIADQLFRPVEPALHIDALRLLAVCEAARVSCRTAAAELPRSMREMLGG